MHELNNCDEDVSLLSEDNLSKSNENNNSKKVNIIQKKNIFKHLNEKKNSQNSNICQYQKEIISILSLYVFLFFFFFIIL